MEANLAAQLFILVVSGFRLVCLSVDMLPLRGWDGVGWPESSLMTPGRPQADSVYTAMAASAGKAARARRDLQRIVGNDWAGCVVFGSRRGDGSPQSSSILQPHCSSVLILVL